MYEWNEEEKKIDFSHNPFSMPQGGLAALEAAKSNEDCSSIKAYQYDIVCNGFELASGAIRNHQPEIMDQGVRHRRLRTRRWWRPTFGGMLIAPSSTAHRRTAASRPASTASSCCWPAPRTCARSSLFPMNQQAQDLLMGAPSEVSPKQLRELHIRVAPPER